MPVTTYIDNENSNDYCDGTDTELLISTVAMDTTTPTLTQYLFQLLAAPAGAVLVPSDVPLPVAIPHGRRLRTGDGNVIVVDASAYPVDPSTRTRHVPLGTSGIPVYPLVSAIRMGVSNPAATLCLFQALLPLYSSNEASFKVEGEEMNFRNFRSAIQQVGRKIKQKASFSCGGEVIKGERSLALMRACANSRDKKLKVQYIPPDGQAMEFEIYVKSDMRETKIDSPYVCKFECIVASPAVYVDLNPQ